MRREKPNVLFTYTYCMYVHAQYTVHSTYIYIYIYIYICVHNNNNIDIDNNNNNRTEVMPCKKFARLKSKLYIIIIIVIDKN